MRLFLVVVCMEYLLDACAEKPGDRDGQRKRGGVTAGLDRVDRLPGHVQPLGKVGLRKPLRDAALANVIAHRAWPLAVKLACHFSIMLAADRDVKRACHSRVRGQAAAQR